MDLAGKNVVYLGGYGGIGQKCAHEFLSRGVKKFAIFDLNENSTVSQALQQAYPEVEIFFVKLDITNKQNIEAAYKEAAGRMGSFDVVVNGSGLMNDRLVEQTITINLLGLINSTLFALEYMDKSKGGNGGIIVNISSVAGLEPTGMFAVYCAAKTGVTAFTRSMANPIYNARTGVNFITICPGFTNTALLDSPSGKETFEIPENELMVNRFMKIKRQDADICAKNLVEAVEKGKNGSVWLLDLGELNEVEFPQLWKPTLEE